MSASPCNGSQMVPKMICSVLRALSAREGASMVGWRSLCIVEVHKGTAGGATAREAHEEWIDEAASTLANQKYALRGIESMQLMLRIFE